MSNFFEENKARLSEFSRVSKTVGARADYVQGGGGNTSVKLDGGLMAIKASGFCLKDIEVDKAYAVLVAAMEKEKKAGIARCVLGNKETLAALRTKDGTLLLNTMYFDEEVQKNPVKLNSESGEKELSLARTVINSMSGKFEPTEFKDEYNERLLKAIDGKVKGKEIKSLGGSKPQKTMDLVDALRRSVLLKSEKPSKGGGTIKQVAKGEKIKKRA